MIPLVRRFLNLPRAERVRTVEALVVVASVLTARRVFSFRRVADWLGTPIANGAREHDDGRSSPDAGHISAARAVDRAIRFCSARDGQCLQRSLALARILRREHAYIRIGARLLDGQVQAHAWVEIGGSVVGEPSTVVRAFAALNGEWARNVSASTG